MKQNSFLEPVLKSLRKIYVVRGVLAISFGLLALFLPNLTLSVFLFLFSLNAIFIGLISIIASYSAKSHDGIWWLFLGEGIFGTSIGFLTILEPDFITVIFLYLFAFWSVVTGLFKIARAIFYSKRFAGTFWLGLAGGTYLLLGLYIIGSSPQEGLLATITIIAFASIFTGIGFLMTAFRLKKFVNFVGVEMQKADNDSKLKK